MPTSTTTLQRGDNPYWDEIRQYIAPSKFGYHGGYEIDWVDFRNGEQRPNRNEFCRRYSWTLPTPEALCFVADWSTGCVVDPMAGTGYWCALLATMGVDTLASDLEPETNRYHKGARLWHPVQAVNGIEAATHPEAVQRTLLLSWPPYGEPVGANILNAYLGPRVIYIGEPCGGCCGDDDLFEAFDRDWELVAEHTPIQWAGIHDLIQVYDRKEA